MTTILAADAVDYSRLMGEDEVATITALRRSRQIIDAGIDRHDGRIANTAGDGLIAEFPSVVEAVTCAIEIQRELTNLPQVQNGASTPLQFRMGLHLGDVIVDGQDLLGDGVNLASRLEAMADPGGILLSQQVYDHVHSKLSIGFEFLGDKRPRNLVEDVPVYRVKPVEASRNDRWTASLSHARHVAEQSVNQSVVDLTHGQEAVQDAARNARVNLSPRVKKAAIVLGVLAVIDLLNGLPFFVQWPALGVLLAIAWANVPDHVQTRRQLRYYRGGVALAGLFGIMLFSLTGLGWVILLALGLGALHLLRQAKPQKA
ncbi:adenylate/guanylate cyclase domain-containing protein [Phaeobacter marinintestinus]|uniref:adenylate/guanylate cyclase domain-containing protein n=1 Tax=Falsiphaeobacter marinintestinus TaxID=1492905 RepID=UPI001FE80085|nr:adenylate/guanylate cyclase domain-containing protein [Phaeobacter marinintestinus]